MSPTAPTNSPSTESSFPILVVLCCWIGFAWFSHVRYAPPPVQGLDPANFKFSAVKAEPIFERLYKDATPHPAGNNADFREKVIHEFRRLGYEVELHETSSPPLNDRAGTDDVPLTNLIVQLVGKLDLPPVMLTAHYDSVPSGPGAADDGVGLTAMIEIARILRDGAWTNRTVIFLITDGEEFGLLGARKFVEEHPLASQVAAVVNLEARGTAGPSIMFETSEDSNWLVSLFSQVARRPFASSLFYEIYRFLPNDTDFTVYKRNGMSGLNFAFIGDVKNYHTPNDNYETVDRRSLQHHGENALGMIQALANADIESMPKTQAVYFDVFGFFVIRWTAFLSIWLAIAGTIGTYYFSIIRIRIEKKSKYEIARKTKIFSTLLASFGLVAVGIFAWLLQIGLTLDGALDSPFPDQPVPLQSCFWTFGITISTAICWLLAGRISWRPVWFGVWLVWSALALATANMLTGASYLFIVPLALTVLAATAAVWTRSYIAEQPLFVSTFGAIAVGAIWLPLERLFYDALGFQMMIALVIRVSLVTTVLLPVLVLTPRRTLAWLTVTGLVASATLTVWAVLGN